VRQIQGFRLPQRMLRTANSSDKLSPGIAGVRRAGPCLTCHPSLGVWVTFSPFSHISRLDLAIAKTETRK
jgi:hypothetical protein